MFIRFFFKFEDIYLFNNTNNLYFKHLINIAGFKYFVGKAPVFFEDQEIPEKTSEIEEEVKVKNLSKRGYKQFPFHIPHSSYSCKCPAWYRG